MHALQVVDALVDGCILEDDAEQRDVESRANCVRALGRATATLYGSTCSASMGSTTSTGQQGPAGPSPAGAAVIVSQVLPSLERSLTDYTTDNRGDVGSMVREAAMEVMVGCLRLLPPCWDPATCSAQLPGGWADGWQLHHLLCAPCACWACA